MLSRGSFTGCKLKGEMKGASFSTMMLTFFFFLFNLFLFIFVVLNRYYTCLVNEFPEYIFVFEFIDPSYIL